MQQPLHCTNTTDPDGNPTGGIVTGTGIQISWQDGPLGRGPDRKEPNGAFVEGVIEAARQRIAFYQASRFACLENQAALECLEMALAHLDSRTKKREEREVEGTHSV